MRQEHVLLEVIDEGSLFLFEGDMYLKAAYSKSKNRTLNVYKVGTGERVKQLGQYTELMSAKVLPITIIKRGWSKC